MRHCKVVNKSLQCALAKLFRSSSSYPLVRGRKAEIRWQATPLDPSAGYERDQPKHDESPVIASYESLQFWSIGIVREESSQVCNPGPSQMKSKYGSEGKLGQPLASPSKFGVVDERESFLYAIRGPVSRSLLPTLLFQTHSICGGRCGGEVEPGPAPGGAVSYPATPLVQVIPNRGKNPAAKGVSGGAILRYIAGNRESNMDLPYGARTTRISSWLDSMRNGFEENPPT
jgi:hypothetical protein